MNTSITPAVPQAPARQQPFAMSRQRWHAHLMAIPTRPRPVPPPARPTPRPAARRLQGASLDAQLVRVPLTLRCTTGYLATWEEAVAMRPHGDGSERWVVADAPGTPGEYNVLVHDSKSCRYLSAGGQTGRAVGLADRDDGSGRQRWTFMQTGDTQFMLAVSGGKADDLVFLGADEGRVRLFSRQSERTMWDLTVVPDCEGEEEPHEEEDEDDVMSGAEDDDATSRNTHVPPVAMERLPLTERQIDVIMQLVSLPENGTPKWYNYYGYAAFLGDGRGFTATIFGACSGTGDLYMVLQALSRVPDRSETCDKLLGYMDKLRDKRGDDISGIEGIKPLIQKLGQDPAWRQAVWEVFLDLYWTFAGQWCDKKGPASKRPGPKLVTAAGRGFMLDTVINHGADVSSLDPIVRRMRSPNARDEATWLADFAKARQGLLKSGYQELDTSGTGDRCSLWLPLFKDNPSLTPPIQAYRGYWGTYTLS